MTPYLLPNFFIPDSQASLHPMECGKRLPLGLYFLQEDRMIKTCFSKFSLLNMSPKLPDHARMPQTFRLVSRVCAVTSTNTTIQDGLSHESFVRSYGFLDLAQSNTKVFQLSPV